MVEITNSKRLEAWFKALPGDQDQKRKVAVTIAHRAMMRVLPFAWREFEFSDWARLLNRTAIPVLRSGLTSGVVANSPSEQVRAVARHAAAADAAYAAVARYADADAAADVRRAAYAAADARHAAYAAADARHAGAAAAAIDAATAAGFLSERVWAQVSTDCKIVEAAGDPMLEPLWQDAENPFAAQWALLKEQLKKADDSRHWQFWIDWYDRSLRGEPQDWEGLLSDVVLIEDEVWKQGFAAVGEQVAALQNKLTLSSPIARSRSKPQSLQTRLRSRAK